MTEEKKRVEYTFGEVKLERSNNTPSRKVLVYFPQENDKKKGACALPRRHLSLACMGQGKRLGSGGRREAASSGKHVARA
jgi:hypothetical protein